MAESLLWSKATVKGYDRILEERKYRLMQLYSEAGDFKLYHGSMLDMLEVISPNFIDSIVTDPPYELNFMNKGWDNSGIAFQTDTWRKCYSVLKPGGYLLAFGGSRTFHRIACAIEEAGFEIRDTIMWLYGSGFPKSMNIGLMIDKKNGVESPVIGYTDQQDIRNGNYCNNQEKRLMHPVRQPQNEWAGWGTALKPAYEPIIVARKPCEGSCVDNVIQYGVGGINIDDCRVPTDDIVTNHSRSSDSSISKGIYGDSKEQESYQTEGQQLGRFPSNVILTYDETDKEEVIGGMPDTVSNGGTPTMPDLRDVGAKSKEAIGIDKLSFGQVSNAERKVSDYVAPMDSGSAARYYYCAKASKRDRDEGLDVFETKQCTGGGGGIGDYLSDVNSCSGKFGSEKAPHKNTHPTVKPVDLMQYLVRLVTPKNGTVLDPFNGSGSTGKAVMYENKDRNANYRYIGIELTAEYLPIADARIRYAAGDNTPIEQPDIPTAGQITIFDVLKGDTTNGNTEWS